MKQTSFYFLMSLLFSMLLNGCATQVKVRSLEPAEIDRAAALHRIAVLDFKNDSPGLSGKIQTELSDKSLDGKPFFTVVDRKNLSTTLKEQKLQYSGLVKEGKSAELGELLGAQALIWGKLRPEILMTVTAMKSALAVLIKNVKKVKNIPFDATRDRFT